MQTHTVYVSTQDDMATTEEVANELHAMLAQPAGDFSDIFSVDAERVNVAELEA